MRLKLGFNQLIHKPILNLLWLLVCPATVITIILKNKIIEVITIPQIIEPVFNIALNIFVFLIPIIMIFAILEYIGELTARKDENKLMVAFSAKDLRNGCPILINKRKIRATDVTVREFYSNIPYDVWIEKKEAIADAMNVHFIEEIQYGGKSNNNGKIIVIKTAKGRKPTNRGILYDEEF
ncbi:hypothetical protein [Thomasclavelia cocleata]|uniref:hypothetical protein n=1 Tax=Thomasclavelia cocleata TaxID=69824 RepID=UPI00255AF80B|nr:hypothetical protein [Thomasclavelia cocleata]